MFSARSLSESRSEGKAIGTCFTIGKSGYVVKVLLDWITDVR